MKLFLSAGVPEEKARKAAEALSAENLATKQDINRIEKELVEYRGRFNLLQWMIGFNLIFTMAILWKIFS